MPCVTVGRGLPAGSQAHSPKAAGHHPKACDVLWATETGRDKLALQREDPVSVTAPRAGEMSRDFAHEPGGSWAE